MVGFSFSSPSRRALDFGAGLVAALLLVGVIVVVDDRAKSSVPGARIEAQQQVEGLPSPEERTAALNEDDLSGEKEALKEKEEDLSGEEEALKEEKEDLSGEKEALEEEKEEPEKDVELSRAEKKALEEEKEELEISRLKELGIYDFCATCNWNESGISCGNRVTWMMSHHGNEEDAAKIIVMEAGGCRAVVLTEEEVQAEVEMYSQVANYCADCMWGPSGISCADRVAFVMSTYFVDELEAKASAMNGDRCSTTTGARRRRRTLGGGEMPLYSY